MVILVRHAMPAFEEAVAPAEWPLSDEGPRAVAGLVLPAGAYLVASAEVKARQTLEAFGTVVQDARFNEVERVGEPWEGDYRELRRAYVDGAEHAGWEPHAAVVARFDVGLRAHAALAGGRPLVVASHGMAMTLWVAGTSGLAGAGAFWESLAFPDARAVPLID
jgi:broad specificity phosphatase PhoE